MERNERKVVERELSQLMEFTINLEHELNMMLVPQMQN